jgi:hypothetical protein
MAATLIFFSMMALVAYDMLVGPAALWRSHKNVMRQMRKRNDRRGITMRPGWTYYMPEDGSRHRSPTGRARDCCCGGKHYTHVAVAADIKAGR